jgi:hypothetical protein
MGILERLDDSGRVRVLPEIMGEGPGRIVGDCCLANSGTSFSSSSGQLRQRKSALS